MENPGRVAFALFGREIYWYGILIALGVLLAIYIALKLSKFRGWKQDDVLDFCIWAIPAGVVGARLYYVAFEWQRFKGDPLSIIRVWEGGVAVYGAIIGGLIAAVLFCKIKKLRMLDLVDIIAPGLVLAQAIGRWGNFFNQEAYGIEVTNRAHMWFPLAVRIDATNTIHYATFFYESVWCLLVFALLIWRFDKFRKKGDVFLTYAMLYVFERMFVEGLRTDSLWLIPGKIRASQLLSAILFVAIAAYFLVRFFRAGGFKNRPALAAAGADFTVEQGPDEPAGESADIIAEPAGETAEEPAAHEPGESEPQEEERGRT